MLLGLMLENTLFWLYYSLILGALATSVLYLVHGIVQEIRTIVVAYIQSKYPK